MNNASYAGEFKNSFYYFKNNKEDFLKLLYNKNFFSPMSFSGKFSSKSFFRVLGTRNLFITIRPNYFFWSAQKNGEMVVIKTEEALEIVPLNLKKEIIFNFDIFSNHV